MGQRHQLFVIAKVGDHYRSLAAVHHQWLFGIWALKQCIQLLRIFSTEANWTMLRQELLMAERYFQKMGPPSEEPPQLRHGSGSPVPFPFILTCLMIGAGYNASQGTATAVHEEPFGMGYDQGDNNDGITVLDITDLSQVRYCFVNFIDTYYPSEDSDDEDGNRFDLLNTPLTGRQYLTSYHQPSELIYQQNLITIEMLDAKPVIEARALAETWPWGEWELAPLPEAIPISLEHNNSPRGPTSLVKQSLTKVVDTALSSETFHFDLIGESIQNIPQFKECLRDCLIENFADRVGVSPSSAPLLKLAYRDDKFVDWSPFKNLSTQCIKAALVGEGLKKTTGLAISGAEAVESPFLVDALSPLDKIDSLYALDMPSRERDTGSLEIYTNLAIHSPHLIQNKLAISGPFSQAIRQSTWLSDNVPTISAFPVMQLLAYHDLSTDGSLRKPPQWESFFLGDALLSPVRAVTGLFRYLECLNYGRFARFDGTQFRVANCFATASSSLGTSQDIEIGPFPAEVYKLAKVAYHDGIDSGCYSRVRDLVPGQWTIFLWVSPSKNSKDEAPSTNVSFKYAFVRSNITIPAVKAPAENLHVKVEDLEAVDVKEFLRQTVPEVETDKLQDHMDSLIRRIYGRDVSNEDVVELRPRILECMQASEAQHLLDGFLDEMPKVEEIHQLLDYEWKS